MKNRERAKSGREIRIGDLQLDQEDCVVRRGGKKIVLPGISFRFLQALAERWPDAVSRRSLMKKVWGDLTVSDDAVRQRARLLRQSLGSPDYVVAVKGIGYRLGNVTTASHRLSATRTKWALGLGIGLALIFVAAWQDWLSAATHILLHELRH